MLQQQCDYFLQSGYHMRRSLDRPGAGNRAAYLATHIPTRQPVILEEFYYSSARQRWDVPQADDISALQQLAHPGVPKFLSAFETPRGICLVQLYKKATPLSQVSTHLSAEALKLIARSTLQILVYLQSQSPPIVHQNIRPENLWLNSQRQVYLVGFGFGSRGRGLQGMSEADRLFKAREQQEQQFLGKATDLYGLGLSLICLLTQTPPEEADRLVDANGLNFRQYASLEVSPLFLNWLDRLVQPAILDRFPDAASALAALEAIDVTLLPEALLDITDLTLQGRIYGETLTCTVRVHNPVENTILHGKWEVVSQTSDNQRPNMPHPWISLTPERFESNHACCQVTIQTQKLLAGREYERKLKLYSNTFNKLQTINLKVVTAPLNLEQPSYKPLVLMGQTTIVAIGLLTTLFAKTNPLTWALVATGLGLGAMAGWLIGHKTLRLPRLWLQILAGLTTVGLLTAGLKLGWLVPAALVSGSLAGAAIAYVISVKLKHHLLKQCSLKVAAGLTACSVAGGMGLGMALSLGFTHLLALGISIGAGLGFIAVLFYLRRHNQEVMDLYRKIEPSLIKT